MEGRKFLRTMIEQVADGTYRPSPSSPAEIEPAPPQLPHHRPGPNDNPFPDMPLPKLKEPPLPMKSS